MINTDQEHTLESLEQLPTYRPAGAGRRWAPIPHAELIHTFLTEGERRRWLFYDLKAHLGNKQGPRAGDASRMAASLAVEVPGRPAPEGTLFSLGLYNQNSAHNSGPPLTVYAGLVTDGGLGVPMLVYELGKHDVKVASTLQPRVRAALQWLLQSWDICSKEVKRLKNKKLTPAEAAAILVQASGTKSMLLGSDYHKLLPGERIYQVDELFQGACSLGNGNAWELLLAFSATAMGQAPPLKQIPQVLKFYEFLNAQLRKRKHPVTEEELCNATTNGRTASLPPTSSMTNTNPSLTACVSSTTPSTVESGTSG